MQLPPSLGLRNQLDLLVVAGGELKVSEEPRRLKEEVAVRRPHERVDGSVGFGSERKEVDGNGSGGRRYVDGDGRASSRLRGDGDGGRYRSVGGV